MLSILAGYGQSAPHSGTLRASGQLSSEAYAGSPPCSKGKKADLPQLAARSKTPAETIKRRLAAWELGRLYIYIYHLCQA